MDTILKGYPLSLSAQAQHTAQFPQSSGDMIQTEINLHVVSHIDVYFYSYPTSTEYNASAIEQAALEDI